MKLRFTKMHGLGNDFVVIDATRAAVELTPARVTAIADRHFGVGCDQLLVVEPATQPGVDFRYRIFNADGGEVEQCGNGARCFARYVHDRGLTAKTEIRVETRSGIIAPLLTADGQVTVDMGVPVLEPARVNAGFLQVVDRHEARLRVYERGAGETLACGTGACAAVVTDILRGLADSPVRVRTRGGDLSIAWAGPGQPVRMTGPAVTVFEGEVELP